MWSLYVSAQYDESLPHATESNYIQVAYQLVNGNFTLPQALRFGFWFSQPLQAVRLPEQLRELDLGFFYLDPLDGVEIPASLEIMNVGFGQRVDLSDVRLFGWGVIGRLLA